MKIPRTNPKDSAYIFFGKLSKPTVFDTYIPDSSNIVLTAGKSNESDNLKYKGYIKILQVSHFSSDNSIISSLYNLAVKEFRKGSRRKQRSKARLNLAERQGKMISIIYSDSEKQFRGIEISKSYNPLTKVHSLFINQRLSDNEVAATIK
ncbi:MAG: hypothetical protein H7258_06045 [Ferruginibacter sp.]|nr:hypothetical protein [Ferruginibacter sp.]